MNEDSETRERIARLEERFTFIAAELRDAHTKIDQMHEILMQAKGAKWMLLAMAALGGALTSMGVKFLPFVSGLPK